LLHVSMSSVTLVYLHISVYSWYSDLLVLCVVTIRNAEVSAMVYRLKCLMLFIHLYKCLNLEFWFEWPQYYKVQVIVFWLMTPCQMVSLCHFFVGICCPCLQGVEIASSWTLK